MEPKGKEESRQTTLQFRCKKIVSDGGKTSDISLKNEDFQDCGTSVVSVTETPEKKMQPPRIRSREKISEKDGGEMTDGNVEADGMSVAEVTEVPEMYRSLVEIFDSMECSLRMLRLRKKPSTFKNVSTQVQIMAKRRFLYTHLAQIKYLCPENLMVEMIRVHDKASLCMVPDLKISLIFDPQQRLLSNQTTSMTMRQAFRSRLLHFVHSHPECSEIPRAILPEPFNQNGQAAFMYGKQRAELLPELSPLLSADTETLLCASHLPMALNKHFSQKLVPEGQGSPLLDVANSLGSSSNNDENHEDNKFSSEINHLITTTKSPLKFIPAIDFSENTPAKYEPTPSKLVIDTPALQTPKVSIVKSPSDKSDSELETQGRSSARKSLMFLQTDEDLGRNLKMENVELEFRCSMEHDEITGSTEDDAIMGPVEDKMIHQMVPKHSRHQTMLSVLPDLFNTIWAIFQSTKRCTMTKQELVHKILFHHIDIEETSEIEEQLKLLETLVPDCIRGKTASSGDFCITLKGQLTQQQYEKR